ncbi:enoyl-CoA hydratase-related protein [Pseudonocardia eucalypti]|uniref:Enoyl-CoA hydratase-related protein n=1 Tax=Pseudonocardia eucalypti TaxID=648755 RepID=A0ABP9QK53_9PSEU|nr:enoyl-CoA hydratase/carnithine racemase [Pseudonocardia eucalypti]
MSAANAEAAAPVLLERLGDGVARITLNRPAQRNAMNRAARVALLNALDECTRPGAGVNVIVLTGSGPAFCAGVDLKEVAKEQDDPAAGNLDSRRASWRAVQDELAKHPAVVIAAVNGFALGGGLTLINAADLAVVDEDAQLGMPEIGFGLYPALAGPATQLRVSRKRAAWLVLTADRIDGRTAVEWGLANLAVPADRVAAEALSLARRVAGYDATGLRWSKRALWTVPEHISGWSRALDYGEDVGARIRAEADATQRGLEGFASGTRNPGQGSAP